MDKVKVKIKFQPKNKNIKIPEYKTINSAGADIYADLMEPVVIHPKSIELIPTGIYVEIPEGYEIQIRPRSGLALKHGIILPNSPGTIDSDYRGEIKIILMNLSDEDFVINPGDRIAQMVLSKVYKIEWELSDNLTDTQRGDGGFGHTGI